MDEIWIEIPTKGDANRAAQDMVGEDIVYEGALRLVLKASRTTPPEYGRARFVATLGPPRPLDF